MGWQHFFVNFFQKSKEKIFCAKKHLLPLRSTLCLPLFTLRNFKMLNALILDEIWLVELKFVAFCHTEIGRFLSNNGQNYVIFGIK